MPIELTEENYSQYVNETANVLLDFWATWCGPCKRMKPDFAAAEKFMNESDTKITFMSVDVDQQEALAQEYEIKCMPTLVLIKDGKIIDRHEGAMNMEMILMLIGKHFDVKDGNTTKDKTVTDQDNSRTKVVDDNLGHDEATDELTPSIHGRNDDEGTVELTPSMDDRNDDEGTVELTPSMNGTMNN